MTHFIIAAICFIVIAVAQAKGWKKLSWTAFIAAGATTISYASSPQPDDLYTILMIFVPIGGGMFAGELWKYLKIWYKS